MRVSHRLKGLTRADRQQVRDILITPSPGIYLRLLQRRRRARGRIVQAALPAAASRSRAVSAAAGAAPAASGTSDGQHQDEPPRWCACRRVWQRLLSNTQAPSATAGTAAYLTECGPDLAAASHLRFCLLNIIKRS